MRMQDHLVMLTEEAQDDLFRNARAIPAERLEWRPMDQGRSVLDLVQECAQLGGWFASTIEARAIPSMTPEAFAEARAARQGWSLDDCERIGRESTAKLVEVLRNYPDEDLAIVVTLPFRGGITGTLGQLASRHHRHMTYHTGQITYIQTLLGDHEMH